MSDRSADTPEPVGRPDEPVQAEPREPDPAVEAEPAAPLQVAPETGTAPATAEPVPTPEPAATAEPEPASDPEPSPGQPTPPPAPAPTEETLALPPATGADGPSSQPDTGSVLTGVRVPFTAPPSERDGGRFATKLVLGICGGVGFVALVVFALIYSLLTLTNSYLDKIETTAETFVADVSEQDWNGAYAALCPDLRERPVRDYVDEWQSWDTDGAEVRPVRDTLDGTYVPVEMGDGTTVELLFIIEESAEMETSICGWQEAS